MEKKIRYFEGFFKNEFEALLVRWFKKSNNFRLQGIFVAYYFFKRIL